jgi:hypothetical protein
MDLTRELFNEMDEKLNHQYLSSAPSPKISQIPVERTVQVHRP